MTASDRSAADSTPDWASPQQAYANDRRYVFHSWSAQELITPMVISSASGSYVTDGDGNRLLDLSGQLVNINIGHQHPKVIAAIKQQAELLCTVAPQHANAARSEAARLIIERAPASMRKVFFTNGGAEAIEYAIRMARLHTGRNKVLSRYRSYHGGTSTAVNVTGDPRRWPNDLGTSGVVHFFGPFRYRSVFSASTEAEECERALAHLAQVIELEGPATIAAIVLETIPGTAGIMPPPPGYLAGVRELCDKHGIIYIADEVMCGFGRTGKWFAYEHYGVTPDLVTFAKGVNSGYVPLGGVIVSEQICQTFARRPFPGGLTYSGHPLACAAAVASITAMTEEGIVDNADRIGEQVLGPGLRELAERHPLIGEVRGLGVFWALDLVTDRASKQPLAPYGGTSEAMSELVGALKANGVLPFTNYHRLHVVPPCTVTDAEAREGLAAIDKALAMVGHHYTG
jgi:taurine--2-oxoglutarate transaminase